MTPAFPTTGRAAAFGGVLLFFLTLPPLLHLTGRPTREEAYKGISERAGAFDYIRHRIYDDPSDVDIAFCGNSLLGGSIQPDYVESELSRALGRRARVVLLPQSWQGPDMNYFVARDLMEQRRVKVLVIGAPAWVHRVNQPHVQLFRVVRYGDHPGALDGLGLRYRTAIYADFVLGAPRQLLSAVRPNLVDPRAGTYTAYGTAAGYLGRPFVPRDAPAADVAPETMIYAGNRAGFRFTGPPLNDYQFHFIRKTAELARTHGATLVILHLPSPSERGADAVLDRQRMEEIAAEGGVELAGVPSARLFRDVPGDFFDYYHDEHLNTNGMNLYTKTITPALIRIYVGRSGGSMVGLSRQVNSQGDRGVPRGPGGPPYSD
jgi:hypothetical protein